MRTRQTKYQDKPTVRLGLTLTLLGGLALAAALPVRAEVITFDDLRPSLGGTPLPSGYHGFDWSNFYVINSSTMTPSGYANGTVSSPNVAYNGFGSAAEFLTASSPFTLNSADFTGAWLDGLTVTVQGLDESSTVIDSTSLLVNTSGPTHETFNWSGLSGVAFSSSGGTSHGYRNDGAQFAMDNPIVNSAFGLTANDAASPVPEPPNRLPPPS